MHGYDVVDHNRFNPEIGSAADFESLVATLRAHGMGHIVDFVPNHVGILGGENAWWMDVLENGEASVYAGFFESTGPPPTPPARQGAGAGARRLRTARCSSAASWSCAFEPAQRLVRGVLP